LRDDDDCRVALGRERLRDDDDCGVARRSARLRRTQRYACGAPRLRALHSSPSRNRRASAVILALFLAGLLGGCEEAAEVPVEAVVAAPGEWLEIPAGVTVLEAELLPLDARDPWEVEVEVLIEERVGDMRYAFAGPVPSVTLDDEGRFYVYDAGNYRVAVFDPDGEFLFQFGSRGEGPGEFRWASRGPIAFMGDLLCVGNGFRSFTLWTAEGAFLRNLEVILRRPRLTPQADGTFVGSAFAYEDNRRVAADALARFEIAGGGVQETQRYVEVPSGLKPQYAVDRHGAAYASVVEGNTTRVVAFRADGTVRWVTDLKQPPEALVMPADLMLDGDGRVYVIPRINRPDAASMATERTVDVLGNDGEHLAALKMADVRLENMWQFARDGYVYGVREDPATFEWQVMRFRVLLPAGG